MAATVQVTLSDYAHIRVAPLTGTIGAEIAGVDIRDVDDDTFAELRDAFLRFKVLFYRDQDVTDDEHLAFARRWGPLEIHPFVQNHPVHPEIIVLDSVPEKFVAASFWHSDVTFEPEPPLGSLLRAVTVPDFGGDTLFANMTLAYEQLPDATRELADTLTATHGSGIFDRVDSNRPRIETSHPVIRTHPETGERAIYVNRTFTQSIEGLDPVEGERLLTELCDTARVPEYQCRFRWRPNSIAQWDNRCTQHYASPDYGARRLMHRATVIGDRPR